MSKETKINLPVYELNCSYYDSVEEIFDAIRNSDIPFLVKHMLFEIEQWVYDSDCCTRDCISTLAVEYLAATCGYCGIRLFNDAPDPLFLPFKLHRPGTRMPWI